MPKRSKGPFDPRKSADEARRPLGEKRAAFEAKVAEARARIEELRGFHERRRAEIAAMLAERLRGKPPPPKPPRGRKPPREEGGEPVPAIPRPKPKPLAGGAAAPLDPDRRRLAGAGTRQGARRGRVPSDADSRQSL